jgi:divalent metal cation (Fe/Co/Zn/Cd) transporter
MMDEAAPDARTVLVRRAFRLEYLTVAWMVVEAGVAIGAGIGARSVSLLVFGIDSVIELVSAGVMIWRLGIELRRGRVVAEAAERAASRIGGGLLLALAAYVVVAAGWNLWMRRGQEFSLPGLVISIVAMPVMWLLSRQKLRVADGLGSGALRADAVEGVACAWLSLAVVIGLLAQFVLGAWWIDSITSVVIAWFLVREGLEAWEGEGCRDG